MKRKTISRIKTTIAVTAAVLFIGIVGRIDVDTYNGIHNLTGTVQDNYIIASNGNHYAVSNFSDGCNVIMKINGSGEIQSIKIK